MHPDPGHPQTPGPQSFSMYDPMYQFPPQMGASYGSTPFLTPAHPHQPLPQGHAGAQGGYLMTNGMNAGLGGYGHMMDHSRPPTTVPGDLVMHNVGMGHQGMYGGAPGTAQGGREDGTQVHSAGVDDGYTAHHTYSWSDFGYHQ
jgi:hypothetical protein